MENQCIFLHDVLEIVQKNDSGPRQISISGRRIFADTPLRSGSHGNSLRTSSGISGGGYEGCGDSDSALGVPGRIVVPWTAGCGIQIRFAVSSGNVFPDMAYGALRA